MKANRLKPQYHVLGFMFAHQDSFLAQDSLLSWDSVQVSQADGALRQISKEVMGMD